MACRWKVANLFFNLFSNGISVCVIPCVVRRGVRTVCHSALTPREQWLVYFAWLVLCVIAMLCLLLLFGNAKLPSVTKHCSETQYLQILVASYLMCRSPIVSKVGVLGLHLFRILTCCTHSVEGSWTGLMLNRAGILFTTEKNNTACLSTSVSFLC